MAEAGGPGLLELADGDILQLEVGRWPSGWARPGADAGLQRLGPRPTLKLQQGSELVVQVVNSGDLDTTVPWHGLRLEDRYDGVP